MSSSIIRKDLPETTRERRYEIGRQGEINVGNLLADVYGFRKVSYGFDGYSEGTNSLPDLVLNLYPPIAIEVKSITPFTKRKNGDKIYKSASYVAVRRNQWYEELKFARSRKAKLILVVEVRLKDKGLYFWFDSDTIEKYMKRLKGERVHIHLNDILLEGNSLIYPDEVKYLEHWNNRTPLDNDSQLNIV